MGIFDKKDNQKDEPKKAVKTSVAKSATKASDASMKDLYKDENAKAGKDGDLKKNQSLDAYRIIVKPLITEKAANQNAIQKYHFEVDYNANKISVAKAVETIYGIKPVSVNISKMLGKTVKRGRVSGKRKNWKKAIVTLPKGKSIQIYEGV
jgi:large subunit ribosomal protein L23